MHTISSVLNLGYVGFWCHLPLPTTGNFCSLSHYSLQYLVLFPIFILLYSHGSSSSYGLSSVLLITFLWKPSVSKLRTNASSQVIQFLDNYSLFGAIIRSFLKSSTFIPIRPNLSVAWLRIFSLVLWIRFYHFFYIRWISTCAPKVFWLLCLSFLILLLNLQFCCIQ